MLSSACRMRRSSRHSCRQAALDLDVHLPFNNFLLQTSSKSRTNCARAWERCGAAPPMRVGRALPSNRSKEVRTPLLVTLGTPRPSSAALVLVDLCRRRLGESYARLQVVQLDRQQVQATHCFNRCCWETWISARAELKVCMERAVDHLKEYAANCGRCRFGLRAWPARQTYTLQIASEGALLFEPRWPRAIFTILAIVIVVTIMTAASNSNATNDEV